MSWRTIAKPLILYRRFFFFFFLHMQGRFLFQKLGLRWDSHGVCGRSRRKAGELSAYETSWEKGGSGFCNTLREGPV